MNLALARPAPEKAAELPVSVPIDTTANANRSDTLTNETLTMPGAADPLAPQLLPAAPAGLSHSTDAPSSGSVRPFGLTRVTPLEAGEAVGLLEGLTYDPQRQVNVHNEGAELTEGELMHANTSQNTQADHQWWTDKD